MPSSNKKSKPGTLPPGNKNHEKTYKLSASLLKAMLKEMYRNHAEYRFEPPATANDLILYLNTLAKDDVTLKDHNEIMDSLSLILHIEHIHHRIGNLSKSDLDALFRNYAERLDFFSKKDASRIGKHKKKQDEVTHKFAQMMQQSSLVSLFGQYISNKLPQNPLLKHTEITISKKQGKEIFANTYPPYAGEPEAKVPLSNIIRSLNEKDRPSLFKLFSADQLMKDFKDAFPWAISSSSSLQKAHKKVLKPNLLGTQTVLKPQIQMSVVQLALLSIDLIGKSVGVDGGKVVAHYDAVNQLMNNLDLISELIDQNPIDNKHLKDAADKRIKETLHTETTLLSLQSKKDPFSNPIINQFCHTNERHCAELLHLAHIKPIIKVESPKPSPHGKK